MSIDEIVQKYVYDMHNPMTSREKVIAMKKDMEDCMDERIHDYIENQREITMYRSSVSGQIVTKAYANMHPSTTAKEVRKVASHLIEDKK